MAKEDKTTDEKSLHTCGLRAFVEVQKKKKAALIREKTIIKK